MMTSIVETHSDEQEKSPTGLSADEMEKMDIGVEGVCAICLENIELKETALIKGCDHAYCVTCILRWATYSKTAKCPQCKNPFDSLSIHRTLDGSIRDYMMEESVCLLVRAAWFEPLSVEGNDDGVDDVGWYEPEDEYEDEEEEDLDEVYESRGGNLRIGNRRWGDNGFVRAGRQEARPVISQGSSSSTRNHHKTGRRAKRTMKREAADRAART